MANRHHKVFSAKLKETIIIPFTVEEETQRDLEEQILIDRKPLEDWEVEMSATDDALVDSLSRTIEELLDANPTILNNKLPEVKNLLLKRKHLRANRPLVKK